MIINENHVTFSRYKKHYSQKRAKHFHIFHHRIILIREAQKKTREQIAEEADISAQFLFYIETGRKSMTAKTIVNLAKALNVTMDFLLLGSVTPMAKIVKNLEGLPPDQLNLAQQFIETFSIGLHSKQKTINIESQKKLL